MSNDQNLTHKELVGPSRIEQFFYDFTHYAATHVRVLVAVFAIILGLVATTFVGIYYYRSLQIALAEDYHKMVVKSGLESLTQSERQKSGTKTDQVFKELNSFNKKYSNTIYGLMATLEKAGLYFDLREWSAAEDAYQQGLKHPKSSLFLKNKARLGLLSIYENQQKWIDAQKIAESLEGDIWQSVRLQSLARMAIQQNQIKEARTYLEQLVALPDTSVHEEAQSLLLGLGQ